MRYRIVLVLAMWAAIGSVCRAQRGAVNTAASPGQTLTLAQAEQLALKNNPRVTIGRLLSLAEAQVTRETRAAELPAVIGNITAVESHTEAELRRAL